MSDNSNIEWTDSTWNFASGCTKISDGCLHCYIEKTPPFRMERRFFDKPGIGGTTGVRIHPEKLDLPLRWRKPRRIFVNSLSDLFHPHVPRETVVEAFAVMALAPQHTYQVLTKRPERMARIVADRSFREQVQHAVLRRADDRAPWLVEPWWPLRSVWIGASVESDNFSRRADALRATPAAVRFISAEPLLGPLPSLDLNDIDWLIAGGESGPGARPLDLAWIGDLVSRCRESGTAPFVKQLGSAWAQDTSYAGEPIAKTDKKGGDWLHWPADLRVREYPQISGRVPA